MQLHCCTKCKHNGKRCKFMMIETFSTLNHVIQLSNYGIKEEIFKFNLTCTKFEEKEFIFNDFNR